MEPFHVAGQPDWHNQRPGLATPEVKGPYKAGAGALVASGVLFVVLAFLDFRTVVFASVVADAEDMES